MDNKSAPLFSRRQFTKRAAMFSATASFVSSEVLLPKASAVSSPQEAQVAPKLSAAGQAEADSRYQHILSLYCDRFDDAQKANLKRMCAELQPALERIRSFNLENGDAPALYLKPLYEREKKPKPNPKPQPGSAAKKS